jgi:hypothetical protein
MSLETGDGLSEYKAAVAEAESLNISQYIINLIKDLLAELQALSERQELSNGQLEVQQWLEEELGRREESIDSLKNE